MALLIFVYLFDQSSRSSEGLVEEFSQFVSQSEKFLLQILHTFPQIAALACAVDERISY